MSKRYHVYGLGAALVDTEIEVTDDDLAAMSVEKGVMTLVDEVATERNCSSIWPAISCTRNAPAAAPPRTRSSASHNSAARHFIRARLPTTITAIFICTI